MSEEDKKKKSTSYTYWVEKNDNFFNGIEVDCKPKKLENSNEPLQTQVSGQSQWNKSGTWEEKKIDLKNLKLIVEEKLNHFLQSQLVQIQDLNITGEGNVVYINKKVKPGYNLDIKFEYKNMNDETGSIKLSQFQDDGDYEISIKDSNSQMKGKIEKESTQIVKIIQEAIKEYAYTI